MVVYLVGVPYILIWRTLTVYSIEVRSHDIDDA